MTKEEIYTKIVNPNFPDRFESAKAFEDTGNIEGNLLKKFCIVYDNLEDELCVRFCGKSELSETLFDLFNTGSGKKLRVFTQGGDAVQLAIQVRANPATAGAQANA